MDKIKKYLMFFLGSAFMALGLNLFLVPAKIAPGGVSGLATVVYYITNIPVGVLILIINIPIFVIGMFNFNKGFMLNSLLGMVLLSLTTEILSFLTPVTNDVFLASISGGVLVGAGIGIVFRYGATTGGTDIIVMLLKKKYKDFSTGMFVVLVDAVIILFAGIVFKTWEIVLYSGVALYISSYIIDVIVEGVNYAKLVFIISDKPLEIADTISVMLKRGTTCLNGVSTYTGTEKNTILCVVKRYEISRLKQLLYKIDPNAFVIVSEAKEVLGNGFTNY